MGPSYANHFVDYNEHQFFNQYKGPKPELYLRFIDNCIIATSSTVHYKPTDSGRYLLYSSSHPPYVKNSIPYSQLIRLRRLCSDDSDFFVKRDYPASVVQAVHHRAQQIDRQPALQTSQRENNDRIPFNLTTTQ